MCFLNKLNDEHFLEKKIIFLVFYQPILSQHVKNSGVGNV